MELPLHRCQFLLACHKFLLTPVTIDNDKLKQFSRLCALANFAAEHLLSQTKTEEIVRASRKESRASRGRGASHGNRGRNGAVVVAMVVPVMMVAVAGMAVAMVFC